MIKPIIIELKEIESTNSYAKDNLASLQNGSVVVAQKQSAGRGRFDRKWISDETSNIYMSIVLKPEEAFNNQYPYQNLTQYLSVVVCRVLESEYKISPTIKWPNDILINCAKLSGILCEAKMQNNTDNALILGLGLNANIKQETLNSIEQKATSLNIILDREIDTNHLISLIIDEFFTNYDLFIEKGFGYIKEEYINRCDFLGKKIKISSHNRTEEFTAKLISDEGTLVVVDAFGMQKNIVTGDLTYC